MDAAVARLKYEFREFCKDYLVLAQIESFFSDAGLCRRETTNVANSQRIQLVEEYYASINWDKPDDILKLLKVIEIVIMQSYLSDDAKDHLRRLCLDAGFEIDENGHTIYLPSGGIGQPVKNLIFAADGPKPEIILDDAISNDIKIVKNAEYCLVYERPIKRCGLLWEDMIHWWAMLTESDDASSRRVEEDLYRRLMRSLDSEPEKLLYRTYFGHFHDRLGKKFPALIPQVYLHYDPYTLRELAGGKRLIRQRMDFLLLLSDRVRIVVEVDGKQHYSVDDRANPKLYAEMVAEDRRLRLVGYEVYRFGGYELQGEKGEILVSEFFERLFEKYSIIEKD